MSLTSFVAIPDVRSRFREEFSRQRRSRPTKLPVRSRVETRYSGRMGTAFDYLLRFAIKHRYPQALTEPWAAEHGLEIVRSLARPTNSRSVGYAIRRAERFMKRAKNDYAAYLKTGEVTDELLESVWRLAYLDTFYRVPIPPIVLLELREVRLGDGTRELRGMLRLAPIKDWKPRELLALNPTFGDGSLLVGGADADIIVDDTIVDIKTSKSAGAPRAAFDQLIGYTALAELGGVDGKPRRIKHLELYMARYGTTYRYEREEMIDEERWPLFLEWFEERAKQANTAEARQEAYVTAVLKRLGL